MKRALLIALSLLIAFPAFAESKSPKKYGVATTIDFQLYQTSGLELKTDATCASGDVKIMNDEGAEANATNCFTDEGQGYSLALTSGEVSSKRVVIYIVDQGTKQWIDKAVDFETFGNASAAQQFDLNSSTVTVGAGGLPADALAADGTAQSGTASTIVLASSTSFADDILNNRTICIVSGTGSGQCRTITNYTGASDTADVSPDWTTSPSSDSEYVVGGLAATSGGSCPSVADIRDGLTTSDANLSSADCHSGSYCAAQAEKVYEGVNDLLQGTPGDDFVATNSPLRFGGVDYNDANFGFGAGYNTFFFNENGQPSGCNADDCRITGLPGNNTSDLDIGLVTETYTGGGGCGTLHQTVIVPRGLLGDTCSAFATNLNNALSGGGGGGCTLTGITCENFKQSYFTANAMADFTWNGLTGFENGGTVTVVSGKTSPATIAYDPQPPVLANVSVLEWNGQVVQTPNTDGVPIVDINSGSQTFNLSGNVTGSIGSLAAQAKTDVEDSVLDAATADHSTTGSVGKAIADAAAGGGGGGATVDEIWETPLSSHSGVAGSVAEALANAGSGGVSPTRRW